MRTPGSHPYLDHPGPVAFAHRGGAEEYPENSLAAFRHAVSLGFRYLETDVHLIAGREPIPTLDALLEEFPDARVNIDPKGDPVVEPLAGVLRRHDALDRVCLGSFSGRRLRRLRRLLGEGLCTSAGPLATAAFRLASLGLPAPRGHHDCLQVPVRQSGLPLVDQRFLDLAHRRGLKVHVWTIDDPAEMHRLLDLGVDGLMTDRPTVLRDVLRDRGAWAD